MARWIIIALLLFPNIALGGVYVSGGVDPVEIGRRIAVSSPGVITLASGSVTSSNTKLSAGNGTAFVDFSTANVLTDYVPYKGKLTITDRAGKKLIGYIKAAGTGETLGDELVTNGGFDSDTTGWTPYRCNVASVTGGQSGNRLEITRVTGSEQQAARSVIMQVGALYKESVYVKSGTSGDETYKLYASSNGLSKILSGISSESWAQALQYFTALATAHNINLFKFSSTAGTMLFDEASVKQVLTPSATGVTITSTPNGTTYNWESQESGFNYNDASGYTYAITTR